MSKLTDEQMRDVLKNTNHMVRNSIYGAFWPELEQACRAIEATATEPLLQRIAELGEENKLLNRLMRSGEQRGVAKGLEESKAQITELERQLEEARKDAERYRWLKEHRVDSVEPEGIAGTTYKDLYFCWYSPIWDKGVRQQPVDIDAAIDAAMQKGQS